MEESSRWVHQNKRTELQQMGRGPGVRATSASSIQIDFRYQGKRCRERIALPPTPANLKYAKRLKATIDHEIATKTFEYAKHFPDSPRAQRSANHGQGLRSALLAYCDSLAAQLEPETVAKYRHDAAIVAKGLGESTTIESLTRVQVRTWVSSLTLSKKRIDNLLTPLRGAINQAVEDGQVKENALAGFKVRRVKEATEETIDPFTPEEIEKLSTASLGNLWKFWVWTGLRSGEIIGLEWGDVGADWQSVAVRRSVRVGRTKVTKTRAGTRVLVLLRPARDSAPAYSDDSAGPVFKNPNTGERWHEDRGLARAFRRDCKAVEVRYRYPYQLRHTFATWALSSGENPAWAAKYMGHKDMITFFKIYAKWMPSLAPEAGNKMVDATKSKAA